MTNQDPRSHNNNRKHLIPLDLALFWLSVIGVSFYIFQYRVISEPPTISEAATGNVIASLQERQEMKALASSPSLNQQSKDFIIEVADNSIDNNGVWTEIVGQFADEARTSLHTAWAYDITGEAKYADHTIKLLLQETNFTPDLKAVPESSRPNRELSWGVAYTDFAQSYSLIENYSGFTTANKDKIKLFYRNLARTTLENTPNLNDNCITNMKWFRASMIASAGVLTNDSSLMNTAFDAYRRYLNSASGSCWSNRPRVIEANGWLGHEMARFDAVGDDTWYYTGFSMSGMVILAEIARQQGVNLWDYTTSDGRNLKLVFDSHVKYFTGTAWPHVGGKGVSYPFIHRDFAGSYQAAYAYWGNSEYLKVLEKNSGYSGDKRPVSENDLLGPFVYVFNGRRLGKPAIITSNPSPTPTRTPSATPTTAPTITSAATPTQTPVPTMTPNPQTAPVLYERWNNIQTQPNALLTDLTSDSRYPANPTSSTYLHSLDLPLHAGTSTSDNNFGSRARTVLVPKQTGSYVFYITADDTAELFLSTDDNPANARSIARVSQWVYYQDYQCSRSEAANCSGSQIQSTPIQLTAGNRYYLEVRHAESIGEDHASVLWRLSTQTTPTVISSEFLQRYTPTLTITSDINNDGVTNVFDLGILSSNYGMTISASSTDIQKRCDINSDGQVNVFDLSLVIRDYQIAN